MVKVVTAPQAANVDKKQSSSKAEKESSSKAEKESSSKAKKENSIKAKKENSIKAKKENSIKDKEYNDPNVDSVKKSIKSSKSMSIQIKSLIPGLKKSNLEKSEKTSKNAGTIPQDLLFNHTIKLWRANMKSTQYVREHSTKFMNWRKRLFGKRTDAKAQFEAYEQARNGLPKIPEGDSFDLVEEDYEPSRYLGTQAKS